MVFAKTPPAKRVLTLQLTNDHFVIPPEADDFRVEARGTLPNDALLLSFLPHMHLRGKQFDYNIVAGGRECSAAAAGAIRNFNYWQMSYRLAEPLAAEGGDGTSGGGDL